MAIWGRLVNMSPREVFRLFKVFIKQPRFIIPTIETTRQCINICDELFEDDHHKNNPTNAFRHALWNYLLCENYFDICNSVAKSVEWSKKITDLHEELAPNSRFEKTMDLHNNLMGRKLFEKFHLEKNLDVIKLLQEEMRKAVLVNKTEEISTRQNHLVYIEERK
ncbi:DUF6973 domain-containing protein [Salegentibacter sediminis]|uniref:DUF6973 domain-containing protein n=1 Tax=Salegentibacter sediminis TaxID=1930251 RepID=UPI0009C059B3|nr:hypothetical protein [Salegentibacter sediminis]